MYNIQIHYPPVANLYIYYAIDLCTMFYVLMYYVLKQKEIYQMFVRWIYMLTFGEMEVLYIYKKDEIFHKNTGNK